MKRDIYCGQVRKNHVGQDLYLTGWVARRRDLGALIFVELRDRSGSVQLVFNPQTNEEAYRIAKLLRPEFVVAIQGRVVEREGHNSESKEHYYYFEGHRTTAQPL